MVHIIETPHPNSADSQPPLELCVYLGQDGRTVMAHAAHPARINGNRATWPIIIPFGTPIREAYDLAIALADQNGIPHLLIKDPKGLFPPASR